VPLGKPKRISGEYAMRSASGSRSFDVLTRFDPNHSFAAQVEGVWHAVAEKLQEFPDRATNAWLKDFPNGSCEITSWVLGRVLLELGFGDWTLVYGWVDSEQYPDIPLGGHEWLEYTHHDGVLYSLDATANQFRWAGPAFLIEGVSPLKKVFSTSTRQHLSSENQHWYEHDLMALPLAYVERELLNEESLNIR
jgi:hypothetical protein